jgi:hypothetical protein
LYSKVALLFNSIAGSKKHYIGLDYDAWQVDPINVYIVVDEATKKQSSKYLNDAKAAINKWSEILKQKSGNEKAWNFNIRTVDKLLNFDKENPQKSVAGFNPPADIIVYLVGDAKGKECNLQLGYSQGSKTNKPVYSEILTSCMTKDGKEEDLSSDGVYSTVLHEFAHDLGLGHAFNTDGDLMCSVEEDGEGKSVDTCYNDPTVRSEPSDMDVKAMMYKYGSDGFKKPNRDMSTNPFFVYTGSIITPAEQELRTNLIIAFGTVAGLIAVGIGLRKIGKKKNMRTW